MAEPTRRSAFESGSARAARERYEILIAEIDRKRQQTGVRDPDEPVKVTVTRAQAWTIYDLLVARAVLIEQAEIEATHALGSVRYRRAADALRRQLDAR